MPELGLQVSLLARKIQNLLLLEYFIWRFKEFLITTINDQERPVLRKRCVDEGIYTSRLSLEILKSKFENVNILENFIDLKHYQ